ncbi:MAG: phage portal protein, partial [Muribaculaceae bacterium]|nr:phage portal protein [Muribaculaceae bacterium]
MSWITDIFKINKQDLLKKSDSEAAVTHQPERTIEERRITRIQTIEAQIQMNRMYDTVVGVDVFLNLPEVFFPIDFIASRIASAHYEIRKYSDDSIVWCTNRSKETKGVARLLTKPNWLQTWKEFVYMHWVQKLATGNGFMRAAMNSDLFDENTLKWEWCKNLWTIPSSMMSIKTPAFGRGFVNMFGCEEMVDVILGYKINGQIDVPYWQVFHDRDLFANIGMGNTEFLWSPSRLFASERNITILKRVYDARNTIYDKCGALGIITNRAQD